MSSPVGAFTVDSLSDALRERLALVPPSEPTELHRACARIHSASSNLIPHSIAEHPEHLETRNQQGNTPILTFFHNQPLGDGGAQAGLNSFLLAGVDLSKQNNIGRNILHLLATRAISPQIAGPALGVIQTVFSSLGSWTNGARVSVQSVVPVTSVAQMILDYADPKDLLLTARDKRNATPAETAVRHSADPRIVAALMPSSSAKPERPDEEKEASDRLPGQKSQASTNARGAWRDRRR
jgi:hypothetical protein